MRLWILPVWLLTILAAACAGGTPARHNDPGRVPPRAPAEGEPRQGIEMPASHRAPFTVEGLTFRGETRVAVDREPRLRTRVTITNTGTRPVQIQYGPCTFNLRAYRHAHRTGPPVWEERKLPNLDPKTGILERVCSEAPRGALIPPGNSEVVEDFSLEPSVQSVLGDSLSPGRYFFTASLWTEIPRFRTPEFPAGSAVLTR